MTKLSVNLNKVALIRNSRGTNLPDLQKVAQDNEFQIVTLQDLVADKVVKQ